VPQYYCQYGLEEAQREKRRERHRRDTEEKRKRSRISGSVFKYLLGNQHLFHERLAIDFKTVEIDAGSNFLLRLCIFSIPVRYVLSTGQEQAVDRFPPSHIPGSTLQDRNSNWLRKNVVNPQAHFVQPARI
jgi:hypothetical protein